MDFGGVDQVVELGPYLIRRATSADAYSYAQADAEMVSETYRYTMPSAFAEARLAEVPEAAARLEQELDAALEAERRGEEPARRSWLALAGDRVVGIAVSTAFEQFWEPTIGAVRPVGITWQLNHLYVRPEAHGSGLGQTLLDLALPGRRAAYLWLVGGNDRARRFYERNGFSDEGTEYSCGPVWFDRPLFRLVRR
ncbi:MAG: GNAT family N-acetyltransferase [Actinomycetia bacterium]|nr:GNAT family N-acetyltransferase [Actinomycetes bacterium]